MRFVLCFAIFFVILAQNNSYSYMKRLQWVALAAILIMIVAGTGCNRDLYNQSEHQRIMDSVSPVDSVEANHTWLLTESRTLIVTTPDTGKIKTIKILTANPRESGNAKVVGEAYASAGQKITMGVTFSNRQTKLYAAAVDSFDYYTITPFDANTSIVNFNDPVVVYEKMPYAPEPQQFTYCFEQQYRMNVDYDFDYNDIVMRISQERTGDTEMRYHVQLAAVGTDVQMAGAIRLMDFKYSDIESVKTVDSLSFNTTNGVDVPDQILTLSKNKSFFVKGRNGEAVLNLFVDGHWATGDLLDEDFGMMPRKLYNVSQSSGDDYQLMVPRTITYIVTFKSKDALNGTSMDRLDPFVYYGYNGAIFEIHQYEYRNNQTLHAYPASPIKTLPWALCIPNGSFRWPIEGVNMGFIMKESHLFGAYATYGHSFGEWSMDHTRSLDWYEYPTENQVVPQL